MQRIKTLAMLAGSPAGLVHAAEFVAMALPASPVQEVAALMPAAKPGYSRSFVRPGPARVTRTTGAVASLLPGHRRSRIQN